MQPQGPLAGELYLELLAKLHQHFRPQTYLEIGIGSGASLALAGKGTVAVGVDPEPQLEQAPPGTRVFRQTSDEFFATHDLGTVLQGRPLQLAFIDGMHLFEFALRDFINVERHSVRPGLTGIAQIYAPRDVPRRHKFKYDRLYVRGQSFGLDLRLILLSFWVTFRGSWEHRGPKV